MDGEHVLRGHMEVGMGKQPAVSRSASSCVSVIGNVHTCHLFGGCRAIVTMKPTVTSQKIFRGLHIRKVSVFI